MNKKPRAKEVIIKQIEKDLKPRMKEEIIKQIEKDLKKPKKNLKGLHRLSVVYIKPQTKSWKNMSSCCCGRKIFKLIAFIFYDERGLKHTRFYAVCKTHFNLLSETMATAQYTLRVAADYEKAIDLLHQVAMHLSSGNSITPEDTLYSLINNFLAERRK